MTQEIQNIPRILIVDDVDTNRFMLRDIIQDMGYQPILAENGIQALKAVNVMWPQLILLDISMPHTLQEPLIWPSKKSGIRPLMQRVKVVLPQPLLPVNTINSPS